MKKISAEKQVIIEAIAAFNQQAKECDLWIAKNKHRCGHSNTPDALGDEGWHKLHRMGGVRDAYANAAAYLNSFFKKRDER